jgi:hypothetical protein
MTQSFASLLTFRSINRFCTFLLVAGALGAGNALATEPAAIVAPAQKVSPMVEKFGNAVTFYLGFNRLPLVADLSNGDGKPLISNNLGEITLKPGLYGQAFLSGKAFVNYTCKDNVDLSQTGSVVMWVSAYEWQRDPAWQSDPVKLPGIQFLAITDHGRQLILMRQGDARAKERLIAVAQAQKPKLSVVVGNGNTLKWKTGKWHLLVVNWGSRRVAISVDGQDLTEKDVAWSDVTGNSGPHIMVGSAYPQAATLQFLIGELTILNHPLNIEEIKWIYAQAPESAIKDDEANTGS